MKNNAKRRVKQIRRSRHYHKYARSGMCYTCECGAMVWKPWHMIPNGFYVAFTVYGFDALIEKIDNKRAMIWMLTKRAHGNEPAETSINLGDMVILDQIRAICPLGPIDINIQVKMDKYPERFPSEWKP